MVQSIRKFLHGEYAKTLSVQAKNKNRKTSLSGVAGKILIVFFAAMLLFTLVSRASESITVARVVVENPRRDSIIHTLTGEGKVVLEKEEKVPVIAGYRIDKVFISPGEPISTNTVLFCYSAEDLQRKYDSIKVDIEKIKIQVEQAQLQYEIAKHAASDRISLNRKSNRIIQLTVQSYQLDLKEKKKELESVKALLKTSGKVSSPYEGISSFMGIEEGKITTGEELVKVAVGDYILKAEFDREQAVNVEVGSKAKITIAGGAEDSIKTEINKIRINENGKSELEAALPKKDYWMGEGARFKVTSQSERFELCVPIQALHESANNQYYVLVTKEEKDILGNVLVATRVNVSIIDKNNSTVAVEGTLSQNDNVIIDSSKYIDDGDKVRIS